jgi:DHA1 family bicyclomycin/chloramphenicol resistance-like MFS transporter
MTAAMEDLGATPQAMQLTTSCYVAGLACGQLVYGPLSDQFGRRRVLLGGLTLYTLAGLAAWNAQSADALAIIRFVQAIGGCSGMVIARAVVRDVSGELGANRGLATMNLMMTAGPGIAPLVGGFVVAEWGWRAIFATLTAMGAANVALVWFKLPETTVRDARQGVTTTIRRYLHLALNPRFLGYAIGGGCATMGWYAFIGAAPGIFLHELGQTARTTGICLGIIVGGVWTGTVMSWRSAGRMAVERLMLTGSFVTLAAAILFLVATACSTRSVVLITGLMFVFNIGIGVAGPAALTQALGANNAAIGSASGLYGFIQMAIGAACAACAAAVNLGSRPSLAAALIMLATCIVAQIMFSVGRRGITSAQASITVACLT